MALSDRQLLDTLSRTPFVDSTELALILGEPHTTVHRSLSNLLADGIVGEVSHGTAHLSSSQRYHLTTQGIREATEVLGFDTPSDFVRAYPMSREWLTLLIRRMDAVASVYRLAASMSPGIDGRRSSVEFHRRGRFDATITLYDGRSGGGGVPESGPAAPVALRPAAGHSLRYPRSPAPGLPVGGQKGIPLPTVSAPNRWKRDNCCSARLCPGRVEGRCLGSV